MIEISSDEDCDDGSEVGCGDVDDVDSHTAIVIDDEQSEYPVHIDTEVDEELIKKLGECCICMVDAANALLTPCNHGFCSKCITRWLQVSSQQACPLCKQRPLTMVQTTSLCTEFTITDLSSNMVIYSNCGLGCNPRARLYEGGLCTVFNARLHHKRIPDCAAPQGASILLNFYGARLPDTPKWWAENGSSAEAHVTAWIRRDLRVLLGTNEVAFVLQVVLCLLARLPATSVQAWDVMRDYLAERAAQFLYELSMYLQAWDLAPEAYDRRVQLQPCTAVLLPEYAGGCGTGCAAHGAATAPATAAPPRQTGHRSVSPGPRVATVHPVTGGRVTIRPAR
eukprot:EG_transcript_19037